MKQFGKSNSTMDTRNHSKNVASSEREQNEVIENETVSKYSANLYKGKDVRLWKILASFAIATVVHLVDGTPGLILIAVDALFAFAIISACLYLARKILLNVTRIEKYSEEKQKMVSYIVFIAVIILVFLMFLWFNNWSNNIMGR